MTRLAVRRAWIKLFSFPALQERKRKEEKETYSASTAWGLGENASTVGEYNIYSKLIYTKRAPSGRESGRLGDVSLHLPQWGCSPRVPLLFETGLSHLSYSLG